MSGGRAEERGAGIDREEPEYGNYFVAAYPPFFHWDAPGAEALRRSLESAPRLAAAPPLGVYVHVPFCVRRCPYCYYRSYDDRPGLVDRYLAAVVAELLLYSRTPALAGRRPSFVYFGGGTPSLLSEKQAISLLRRLRDPLPWSDVGEVSFECAPRSVTESKLRALRDAGVTRLSLGVQQLDDDVLRRNGRVHLVRDAEAAYAACRRVGFEIVNVDLMAGLIGETDRSFDASLERVVAWAPESVTLYPLEIPRYTPLYHSIREGRVSPAPASWGVKRERLARGFARLESAGYAVRSAYAAVRDPDRHRFVYQDEQYRGADVLGIGVASFSYLSGFHGQNRDGVEAYLAEVEAGELPLARGYALSPDERLVREVVLQLKLGRLDRSRFRDKFGVDLVERFRAPLARLEERGWMAVGARTLSLTRAGLLHADRLVESFYLPRHRGDRYR